MDNLAERIAVDLAAGELSDMELPTLLDVVVRTLEALPDFGVEIVPDEQ
jgi:hypothetical protein